MPASPASKQVESLMSDPNHPTSAAPPLFQASGMDLIHTAGSILNGALAVCLEQKSPQTQPAVIADLRAGNAAVLPLFKRGLAERFALHLGWCDDDIKSVYLYNHNVETAPTDQEGCPLVVHLIVWAQPKTAALNSLITILNRALTRAFDDLASHRLPFYLLDVQVVDDLEVKRRAGYASLLFSPRVKPLRVWQRESIFPSYALAELPPR